jgi:hypothetical protein
MISLRETSPPYASRKTSSRRICSDALKPSLPMSSHSQKKPGQLLHFLSPELSGATNRKM